MTINIPGFGKITATKSTLFKIAKMADMADEYAIEYDFKNHSLLYRKVSDNITHELNKNYLREVSKL